MTWTNKYKKSIDCNNPKGFSQKAHCQARKLRQMGKKTESQPVNEQRVDKHETSGYVVIDGHVFRDHGKSGRFGYARYRTGDPDYVKDPKETGLHRNYRRPSTLDFDTLAKAKAWVKTRPKKSAEEIDRIHKKHADFEKELNEEITNSVGTGGYSGSATATGPVAGFDPLLGKMMRRKVQNFKTYIKKKKDGTH